MGGLLTPSVDGAVMDFDPYNTRTAADASQQLGALINTSHGRDVFRYSKVGAANISKGKLELAPAPVANHINLAVPVQANGGSIALGSKRLQVTLGGTAATNGQYDQGFLAVNAGTGLGQNLSILHNNVQAGTTSPLTLDLDDALFVALATADSKVSLIHNPFAGIVEAAVKTRQAAGVSLIDLVAAAYGWVKSKGIAGVLIGSAATLGGRLTSDGTTAGAVTDNTDVTTVQTEVQVGWAALMTGTTNEYDPIVLAID